VALQIVSFQELGHGNGRTGAPAQPWRCERAEPTSKEATPGGRRPRRTRRLRAGQV